MNTEQCSARPGEAASVYNCVEQETLISAGGGKNCQTRALNSQQSSPMLTLTSILDPAVIPCECDRCAQQSIEGAPTRGKALPTEALVPSL